MDLTNPGMSFRVKQFHVSQMSAQKPKKKMNPVQKKIPKSTTNTYSASARRAVQAQSTHELNCCSGARAGSCQALAKTFPWYPLALPELRAEVSISTPRGCEGEMGHRARPKKGAGTHSPCLADRDCFLFQLICKICYVETSFFATAFYIKNRCLRDLTVLVSRGC